MKTILNKEQLEAVNQLEGPIMIIAGAGSGKTRVISYKISHLINNGVDPNNILSLTFTNKAAKEMISRTSKIISETLIKKVWIGTFHSIFCRILRIEGNIIGYNNFTIYDTNDSLSIITKIINNLNLNKEIYKPKIILSKISYLKNKLISVDDFLREKNNENYDTILNLKKLGDIYQIYNKTCVKNKAIDLDDILYKINEIFIKFPHVLAKYQNIFKYILVDEYQDTNYSQYTLIKQITKTNQNICVVGDDAQSIYGFRGANIENILSFKKDYPQCKIFYLNQNYRSTSTIVKVSNEIIKNNINQFKKNTWTQNDIGEKINLYKALSTSDEADYISNEILYLNTKNNLPLNNFAILYRTNAQSRAFEEFFSKKRIRYKLYGGVSFYQRKEIKDIIAYIKILVNQYDNESLIRIINYPSRKIGRITIDKIEKFSLQNSINIYDILNNIDLYKDHLYISKTIYISLKKFINFINEFITKLNNNEELYQLVGELVTRINIIEDLKENNLGDSTSKIENINELLNHMKYFIEYEENNKNDSKECLNKFLENINLSTNLDQENNNSVSLMTIHQSKGLEFDIIFLPGLEESIFPSSNISSNKELEEERRLFYVAVTRSKKKLYISYSYTRYIKGKLCYPSPSRFIKEINSNYINFKINKNFTTTNKLLFKSKLKKIKNINIKTKKFNEGNIIIHKIFGKGIILKIEERYDNSIGIIKFKNNTKKILLTNSNIINIDN